MVSLCVVSIFFILSLGWCTVDSVSETQRHVIPSHAEVRPSGCTSPRGISRSERRKQQLEEKYRHQSKRINSDSTSPSISTSFHAHEDIAKSKVTMLFGHVHHAGGTAFCLLARNNTVTNPKDNCNHPQEFKGPPYAPTSGSIAEQVAFQHHSPWQFYSVELRMPTHLKFNGPFIYGIIFRNPYLLLMSQFRRSQNKFQFKGDLIDLVHLQLTYVGVTTVNFRHHMQHLQQQNVQHEKTITGSQNYFRGQGISFPIIIFMFLKVLCM